MDEPLIHFETLSDRPRVFRMTQALVMEAKARNQMNIPTSLGEDLRDLSWLSSAVGLVTHNDVLKSPEFPLSTLNRAAPRLRWIHITGAGIEPLLPLDWLPEQTLLTNNSGVHADKVREIIDHDVVDAEFPRTRHHQQSTKRPLATNFHSGYPR